MSEQEYSALLEAHEKLIAKNARIQAVLDCAKACMDICDYPGVRAVLALIKEV